MSDSLPVSNSILQENISGYDEHVKSNERNPIATVYNSLLNLGINDVDHHNQQKYIRLTNFIAINSFLGSIVYLCFALFWEQWYWFGSVTALSLTCLVVLLSNAYGKTNTSRFLYLVLANSVVFVNGLLIGPSANVQIFFIVSVLVPFLIYDVKDIAAIVFGVLFPVVLIYTYDYVVPLYAEYHFPLWQQIILERVGVVTSILLAVIGVYQLVKFTKKTETELETSNAQLMLQTAELRRSNSDLEQFAYIISHDLKTPVRNISSFMNLLVNKHSDSLSLEAKEFVGYSHLGAKRLERLIDDVLAYCRIGTNLPRPIPVNLNDIINTIRFESREKLSSTGAQININRELPIVNNVHSSLIFHIFQNLIANGLKFNASDKPLININWTNSLNYYTFSVQDNGIGISQEYATTIFQMFKRLHNENEYDGTGIGLAICKKIVEYYHGEIWFQSDPQKGTIFYFTIRKF